MKNRALVICTAALFGMAATSASAAEFVGDTTGGPTWNRPSSLTTLAGSGIIVPYEVTAFTVDATGSYDFSLNSNTPGFDPFLHLYQNSFDPNDQLTNLLALNDDGFFTFDSSFSFDLVTGTSYFAIANGFLNDDFGAYTLTIAGPGNVAPGGVGAVPEPATWAFMILGFAAIGFAMRRRKTGPVRTTVSFAG